MRVLFTSTSGWGHLHPMVPLAKAFVDHGDEVVWATAAEVTGRLEDAGLATLPCGLDVPEAKVELDRRYPEIDDLPPSRRPDVMFPALFGDIRTRPMLEDLWPAATRWAPDLVVAEAAEFAGHLVAAGLGVPSVTHGFGALVPEHRVAAASELVAPLWREHGLEPRPYGGCYEWLYLDIYPPSLDAGVRSHVPVTQLLRPGSFATGGPEALPAWTAEDAAQPLVYVTLGTIFSSADVLAAVVAGLRELPVRVVVTVGPSGDPAALGDQPPHVHVARYIPQDQLLGDCSLVVSHVGSGTFLAAAAAGLPQLCLPQAADQFRNAAACARAGTGLVLEPGQVSADAVRSAATRLLGEGPFRDRAAEVRAELAGMPAPDEVVARLHSLAT